MGAMTFSSATPKSSKWTVDDTGIPFGPYGVGSIQTLLSDNAGEAVAITDIGIFAYNDSTASWKSVAPSISSEKITSAFYNPNGRTYAGTEWNGVFLVGNLSSGWVQCGIDPRPVTSVGFDGSGTLFAGTDDGVFEKSPKDGAWLRASDGLTHSTVYQLYYSTSSKRLYASTAGGASYLPDKENYSIPVTEQWTYNFAESADGNKYHSNEWRNSHFRRDWRSLDPFAHDWPSGDKYLLSRAGYVERSVCGHIA